jgi:predicted PurR-regulated permease PerM
MLIYYGGNVVLPFIFAIFITLLLLPLVNFLERIHFPKWLSALLAVLFVTAFIGGIGFFVYLEIDLMVREMPEVVKSNQGAVKQTADWFASFELAESIEQFSTDIVTNSAKYLQNAVTYISSTLMMLLMIPIYVFFMLVNRDRVSVFLRYKYKDNIDKANKVALAIGKSVQNYIVGLFFVILSVGVLLSTGLYFLDIPYWLLLGIICALLGLLPYIGVVIGALLPLTIAFLTKDSLFYPIAVMALFVLVQFLEGNVITPNIIGNAVNINPVILMLGLLLMGTLSGILGLVLTIPMLAVLRILFEASDDLRPYARLMANDDEE